MTTRKILIEIDAEDETCGETCPLHYDRECVVPFGGFLNGLQRLPECLAAERKAKEGT